MVGLTLPSFQVPGVIADIRDLKTKEGKVWSFALKIMAMGGTYELQTPDEKLAKSAEKLAEVNAALSEEIEKRLEAAAERDESQALAKKLKAEIRADGDD